MALSSQPQPASSWRFLAEFFQGRQRLGPGEDGKKDLGVAELPPLDMAIIDGARGWVYHTGGHVATASDWSAFLDFAGKHFQAAEANDFVK